MRSVVLILAPFFLLGCQTEPKPTHLAETKAMTPRCQAKDSEESCRILVDISPDPADPKRKCIVAVRASQKEVGFKRGAKDKLIEWQIDGAPPGDYQFTSAGIAPKENFEKSWDENFKNGVGYGRTFKWKNKNDAPGTFEYKVVVVSEDGVSCVQDPKIVNQ